jgi:hypothetical protein
MATQQTQQQAQPETSSAKAKKPVEQNWTVNDPYFWAKMYSNTPYAQQDIQAGIPNWFANVLGIGQNPGVNIPSYGSAGQYFAPGNSVNTGIGIPQAQQMQGSLPGWASMWGALSQLFPQQSFQLGDLPNMSNLFANQGGQNINRLPSVMSAQFLKDQQNKITEGTSILPALQEYITSVWGIPWEQYIGSVQSQGAQGSAGAAANPSWSVRRQK